MSNKNNQNSGNFFQNHWQTLVIFALLFAVAIAYALGKPNADEDPALLYKTEYPLLDPNRRIMESDDIITNIQPLRDYLRGLPEANKDWALMSIYFEYLPTGANITVNSDLRLWPASLAKLPLAMVVMKRVEEGTWSLDKKITMEAKDADTVRTPDIARDIGRSYDVKFLLERLLLESDNTAYRMLLKNFTREELNSIGELVGLDQFFSEEGAVSAKDYSRLFRVLYLAAYLNEENSQFLLKLMQDSEYKDFIRGGIPGEVPFAHKWGTNLALNAYGDAGIVYIEERPYLISVMIQARPDLQNAQERVDSIMKEIGQKSYEYISQHQP